MGTSLGSEQSYLLFWMFVFWSLLKFSHQRRKWFCLDWLVFSWCAQILSQIHELITQHAGMVLKTKTDFLHYVIKEMRSFPMSASIHLYDKPLPKYLDTQTVLIYRPHSVHYTEKDAVFLNTSTNEANIRDGEKTVHVVFKYLSKGWRRLEQLLNSPPFHHHHIYQPISGYFI